MNMRSIDLLIKCNETVDSCSKFPLFNISRKQFSLLRSVAGRGLEHLNDCDLINYSGQHDKQDLCKKSTDRS
jgi:hypothetical protein